MENKSIRYLVKFHFQITRNHFCVSLSPMQYLGHGYTEKLCRVGLKFYCNQAPCFIWRPTPTSSLASSLSFTFTHSPSCWDPGLCPSSEAMLLIQKSLPRFSKRMGGITVTKTTFCKACVVGLLLPWGITSELRWYFTSGWASWEDDLFTGFFK